MLKFFFVMGGMQFTVEHIKEYWIKADHKDDDNVLVPTLPGLLLEIILYYLSFIKVK